MTRAKKTTLCIRADIGKVFAGDVGVKRANPNLESIQI